jgi:hypothetical protein
MAHRSLLLLTRCAASNSLLASGDLLTFVSQSEQMNEEAADGLTLCGVHVLIVLNLFGIADCREGRNAQDDQQGCFLEIHLVLSDDVAGRLHTR